MNKTLDRMSKGAVALALLAACGDSGASGSGKGDGLGVQWELAQTHVIAPAGRALAATKDGPADLHLVGGREALVLVTPQASDVTSLVVEGWSGTTKLGEIALAPPANLPGSEAGGPAYSARAFSGTVPAAWVQPGLSLRARAPNHPVSPSQPAKVGADVTVDLTVLPFYLFGANDSNTKPLSETGTPDAATHDEIFAKWPVASLQAHNHPAGRVAWDAISIDPRQISDNPPVFGPAYRVKTPSDQKEGFAVISAVLQTLHALRVANGEGATSDQWYGPILMVDGAGKSVAPGGGLGGGAGGAGTASYSGIFIHEQGHAMGLPHQGDAWAAGNYPYADGSLEGSAWGWDATRLQLLPPIVPATASSYKNCAKDTPYGANLRRMDSAGRCIKQDPMQSGAGDQDPSYKFATFSDFSTAQMQQYLEGKTTAADGGAHKIDGRLYFDESFPGRVKQWDSLAAQWVGFDLSSDPGLGIDGLNRGLPTQWGVPVAAIVLEFSLTNPEVNAIEAPLLFKGNLRPLIDPTDATQLASIVPDKSAHPWFCRAGGCDYTVRVTYGDGTARHYLIQNGFRPWNQPEGAYPAKTSDPLDSSSFKRWALNVPADKPIAKVELLDTPTVWKGMPASPKVLLQR